MHTLVGKLLDEIFRKDLDSIMSRFSTLQDKSEVVIVVDYSRDYTVVNGVQYFFHFFSLLICDTTYFSLLRSAK